MLENMIENLRQRVSYPKDFRIDAPDWDSLSAALENIADILKTTSSQTKPRSKEEEELLDMAADVGTLVWRLERRFSNAGELPKDLRRAARDLESTRDALEQRGIEIKDHTGQDYDEGMRLKVVTSQPIAGLSRQQIIETLKPSIYHRNRIIQMGDVIVGAPEE